MQTPWNLAQRAHNLNLGGLFALAISASYYLKDPPTRGEIRQLFSVSGKRLEPQGALEVARWQVAGSLPNALLANSAGLRVWG